MEVVHIKVCMPSSSYPRFKNDVFVPFIHEFAKHLVAEGCEVHIVAPYYRGTPFYELMDGVHVHRFRYLIPSFLQKLTYNGGMPERLKKDPIAKFQLPSYVSACAFATFKVSKRTGSDLIHAQWGLQAFASFISKKLLSKPLVTTVHGAELFLSKKRRIYKALLAHGLLNSDMILANSENTRKEAEKFGVPASKIITIHQGVDLDKLKVKEQRKIQLQEVLNIRGKLLLTAGRLVERKGIPYLLLAMKEVVKQFPRVKLVIVGDGPEKLHLIRLASELGIKEKVVFTGFVSNQDLACLYSLADIFVLPSIVDSKGDTEGLGVVLLEAMAMEKPVIGTNVGGIPDVITDKVTGFLVSQKDPQALAEKICMLLTDKKLAKKMGEAGKKKVLKHFTWREIAKTVVNIYRQIIYE
jgi:glycosyltransferase involved in cell wall biosynthesis